MIESNKNINHSERDIKKRNMKEMYVKSYVWSIIVSVMLLSGCASNKNVSVISPDIVMDDNVEVQKDYCAEKT